MSPSEALHRVRINGIVSAVIAEIEAKIGDSVTSYTTSLPPAGSFAEKEGKAIKDSVWGMIHFSADETAIIDSPRLQRLRGVRQLGVTYLTYPTAGYSRFEHTLGVVHQCDKMWRAIRQRTSRDLWSSLEDSDLRALRLAALVHDVGHMPFSHLSERFFDETEHVSEAIANKWKGVNCWRWT